MQVPRRRGDVDVTHQPLDDVDVHAPAQEARGIGVPPAVREVATGDTRFGPRPTHEAGDTGGAEASLVAVAVVRAGVSEEEGRLRQFAPQVQILVEDRDERGREGNDPGLVALAHNREPPGIEVHAVEAQDRDLVAA